MVFLTQLSVDGEDLHLEEGNLTNIQLKEKVETLTITYDGFPVKTNIVDIKNTNKMITAVEIFPVGKLAYLVVFEIHVSTATSVFLYCTLFHCFYFNLLIMNNMLY